MTCRFELSTADVALAGWTGLYRYGNQLTPGLGEIPRAATAVRDHPAAA